MIQMQVDQVEQSPKGGLLLDMRQYKVTYLVQTCWRAHLIGASQYAQYLRLSLLGNHSIKIFQHIQRAIISAATYQRQGFRHKISVFLSQVLQPALGSASMALVEVKV